MANRHRTLIRGFQIYTCRDCGKRTRVRDVIDEAAYHLEMCLDCYEDAGMENEHADGHHDITNLDCRYCRAAERKQ